MADRSIYTVGGTVQAGGGIYIPRKADEELLEHCRASELAFILSSRQVGKSSLMKRTADQLKIEHIHSATIDLSSIGTQVTQEEWYLGMLNVIAEDLHLAADIFAWWTKYAGLGPSQRFFNFLRDVMLKELQGNVVLFFDEIDTTLSLSFADDFFASVRAAYNARSTTSDFKRLSFVLVGVATPSDLISDNNRTPFNIGHRVDLNDFALEEAMPLAQGLGDHSKQVLEWVIDWTGGHPYLTQRLCAHLSKNHADLTEESVEQAVRQLFGGEQGWQDNNLQFVRDMLTKRAPDIQRVLKTYKDIRSGKRVSDDERSIPKAHLKISGVVRRENGRLLPRNRIYERAFDLAWVRENTPPTAARRLVIALSFITVFALMLAGYFALQEWNRTDAERANRFDNAFQTASIPKERLDNLAGLFALNGNEYSFRAINLFNSLQQEQKLELFNPVTARSMKEDQLTVALGVYQFLGFKPDADEQGDEILAKIRDAMSDDEDAPESERKLKNEITLWLEGRTLMNLKKEEAYPEAKSKFANAVRENPKNPALYYDLARVYIEMGKMDPHNYRLALEQLEAMLQLDPSRNNLARLLIEKDEALSQYWSQYGDNSNYPLLANTIITTVAIVDEQGVSMILIPEGVFNMGSDTGLDDEKPVHEVNLSAYYIDQYEVTNAAYKLCVDAGVCQLPRDTSSATRASYYGNSQFDNYPVISVDWSMSNAYCEWRGARLPTEAEWEKAARGTDGRTYPWGENIDSTFANYNGDVGDTTAVGSYASGQSPYGVYDMAGNVWEWVNDWYGDTYYQSSPSSNPFGPDVGQSRVLRGGAWSGFGSNVRSASRYWNGPSNSFYYVGFRCSRSQ